MDDLVISYYESLKKIKAFQAVNAKEKIVSDSARVIRQEIIDIKFSMQWLPKTDDLKVTNFNIPTLLNSFLNGVLASTPEAVTDRLKLLLSQDLTYAGMYYLNFFVKIFRNTISILQRHLYNVQPH